MQTFEGIAAAATAVRAHFYRNEDQLFPFLRERLEGAVGQGGSPVDLIVNYTKIVYANRGLASGDDMALAAACAELIDREGYHGKLDGRAARLALALRRDSGEEAPDGVSWPKGDDDPTDDTEMRAPPPPEEAA